MTYNERLEALRKARKRDQRRDVALQIVVVVGCVIGAALLIGGLALLGAVITKFAWNYGVVAIASALGASIGKISLLTAFAINLCIGIVGRIFRPTVTTTTA